MHDTHAETHGKRMNKNNKPCVQYEDTLWIPAAQWNNRHWACPNISSRPEEDSARQKDGQENGRQQHRKFVTYAMRDKKMGKAMVSNDIAFVWHTRSLRL